MALSRCDSAAAAAATPPHGLHDMIAWTLPYLSLADATAVKGVSHTVRDAIAIAAHRLGTLTIAARPLDVDGPCARVLQTYGKGLVGLEVCTYAGFLCVA